jgi:predicted dehydrogenase
MKTVRWGILGTAQIAANVFIPALRTVRGAELAAVASRDARRAEAFAAAQGAARAFGSYDELLDSGGVDALYVPLPNSEHERWTLAAAERGIPVFCEKPLTDASASAASLAARCRELAIPLVEAFVFRYHPQTRVVRELLAAGRIGTVSQITGHMSFFFDRDERAGDIRMDPAMGGGGLLDVVCYPIAYIRHVLDAEPLTVQAAVRYDERFGVDGAASLLLELPGAVQAVAMGGFDDHRNRGITITGSAGTIHVPEPYHPPDESTIQLTGGDRRETITLDNGGPAFAPAIAHFQDRLSAPGEPLTADFAAGTLRVIEAAHESARTGARVSL